MHRNQPSPDFAGSSFCPGKSSEPNICKYILYCKVHNTCFVPLYLLLNALIFNQLLNIFLIFLEHDTIFHATSP